MPIKKTYFVRKDSPKRRDYRFNYQRTPESALKFRVGQYWEEDRSYGYHGVLFKRVKVFHPIRNAVYDTRKEAEAVAAKWDQELAEYGMSSFMKAVVEGKI